MKDYFDGAGYVTNRVFGSGKKQTLAWDGFGRLVSILERDTPNNGFNWSAVYDGFGRRLSTVTIPVVNGSNNLPLTLNIDSYYDPRVEFDEIAVGLNGQRTWKITGVDLTGGRGEMNATGALEGTIRESDGVTVGSFSDCFGTVVANTAGTTVAWNSTRSASYGPILGYRGPTLSLGAPIGDSLGWRSRWIDQSGFYYLGARYYDPIAGHFLSPDPLGNSASLDLYSFCNGDALNYFDSNGRGFVGTFVQGFGNDLAATGLRLGNGLIQLGAVGSDMIGQSTASVFGYGGSYQGYSQLYQNIYANPGNGPTAAGILLGTGNAELNIATFWGRRCR